MAQSIVSLSHAESVEHFSKVSPGSKSKLFVFFAVEAQGHINPLLSVADVLKERGHRTVFLCWDTIGNINHQVICIRGGQLKHRLSPDTLAISSSAPASQKPNAAGQSIESKLIRIDVGKEAELVLTETMESCVASTSKVLNDPKFDANLQSVLDELKPDVVVVDHIFTIPPIMSPQSRYKWARMFSPNPLKLFGLLAPDTFPAPFLGVPVSKCSQDDIRVSWEKYNGAAKIMLPLTKSLADRANIAHVSMVYSPYVNFYIYPKHIDYSHELGRPLPDYVRCSSMVRNGRLQLATPEQLIGSLPDDLKNFINTTRNQGRKLVFVSMGTLASIDIKLMKRLVACLAQSPHSFIISKGPRQDEFQLAPNMWGQRYLPQKELLAIVDAAVIHGGNNSFTECLHIGVPAMVICPMFADQFDNARRIEEKNLGVSVIFSEPDSDQRLLEAIETVLNNEEMKQNIKRVSQEMQEAEYDGPEVAANHLEQLARA